MVDVVQIDHVEDGLGKLPAQWKNSKNFRGVLQSYLEQLNLTEQALLDIRDGFNVNTAIGAQLDIIGGYFGEPRAGRNDNDYRAALLSLISSSNGSGTPNQLMDLFGSLANTGEVKIWEHYPHGISLLASNGDDVDPNAANSIQRAKAAAMEFAGLLYDPYGFVWIPYDTQLQQFDLVTSEGDNVVTDLLDQIVIYSDVEEVPDGNARSSFVDQSVDGDNESGYGENYGLNYGGSPAKYSHFCECSILDNPLTTNGGFGFVEWAGMSEHDPVTGTTNKAKPIKQLQESGLKRRQPLARQFFNWMMANIDSWFKNISDRTPVGAIRQTTDNSQTVTDFANRFGGTWVYLGTETYTAAVETVYVFKRTA